MGDSCPLKALLQRCEKSLYGGRKQSWTSTDNGRAQTTELLLMDDHRKRLRLLDQIPRNGTPTAQPPPDRNHHPAETMSTPSLLCERLNYWSYLAEHLALPRLDLRCEGTTAGVNESNGGIADAGREGALASRSSAARGGGGTPAAAVDHFPPINGDAVPHSVAVDWWEVIHKPVAVDPETGLACTHEIRRPAMTRLVALVDDRLALVKEKESAAADHPRRGAAPSDVVEKESSYPDLVISMMGAPSGLFLKYIREKCMRMASSIWPGRVCCTSASRLVFVLSTALF